MCIESKSSPFLRILIEMVFDITKVSLSSSNDRRGDGKKNTASHCSQIPILLQKLIIALRCLNFTLERTTPLHILYQLTMHNRFTRSRSGDLEGQQSVTTEVYHYSLETHMLLHTYV